MNYHLTNLDLSEDEINSIISSLNQNSTMALINSYGETAESDTRRSRVKFIMETEFDDFYGKIVSAIEDVAEQYFPDVMILNRHLQITEYDESYKGHFDWHKDGQSDDYGSELLISKRQLSFTVQLSDTEDYEGGDFEFQEVDLNFRDKLQMVVFRSDMVHRVTPVTKGTRYALVGWLSGEKINA